MVVVTLSSGMLLDKTDEFSKEDLIDLGVTIGVLPLLFVPSEGRLSECSITLPDSDHAKRKRGRSGGSRTILSVY